MKKLSSSLLGAMLLAAVLNPTVYASDTDVSILNNVMDDIQAQREANKDTPLNNFRKEITAQYAADGLVVTPNDPKGPLSLEGNNITYNSVDGDYQGQGDIKLTHNFSRVTTDAIKGNTKEGSVDIETPAHFLQLADPKVDVQAATTQYDYQAQKGHLTNVEGRIDNNYIKGEDLVLDGGDYTLTDGIITRCSSEKPPYYVQADKVVVTKDVATFYKPKFVINGKVIYSKDLYVVQLNKSHKKEHRESTSWFPYKIRYSNSNGITFGYNYDHKLADKVFAYAELRYSTKTHVHNIYGVSWENGPQVLKLESGKFEDDNNRWLNKKYSLVYNYGHRLGNSPYSFNLHNEYGLWEEDHILSHHREHDLSFSRDPIILSKTLSLYPSIGYKIVSNKVGDNTRKGLYYSGTLINKFSDKVVGYAAYHYTRTDAQNTVFKFGQNDFSKEVAFGLGVELTPIDRLVVASEFDGAKAMSLQHLDYYWRHDFKFMSTELKYEQKEKRIYLHFDFYDF